MLTAAILVLLSLSLATGFYAFAEGRRGLGKSVAWSISLISALILAAILLISYFRFAVRGFPIDW